MKEKVVLYFGGGVMAGVFGAGILTALQENNIYDRIKAIYSGSAGAFNAAYFLARQSELGATIYWEDLPEGFIYPLRIFSGTFQRFWNRYISFIQQENMHNVVDIDYLMDIVERKKRLDIETLKQQPIPLYVKVLNIRTGNIEYFDARQTPFQILKSSASVIPYYYADNQEYIDAEISKEPIGLNHLLTTHPENRVVVAINYTPDQGIRHFIKNSLEGIVASTMYAHLPIFSFFSNKIYGFRRDIEKARRNKRVLLVYPPDDAPIKPNTKDLEKLKATYQAGRREAEKILEFIN